MGGDGNSFDAVGILGVRKLNDELSPSSVDKISFEFICIIK